MGAGRRTSTYDIDTGAAQLGFVERQRNLGENLGGVIFGCSHDTYDECVTGLIFGLPRPHICYVQYIVPGMPVFLYNYSDRTMHGIYKAVSEGDLEINPRGWTTFPNQRTQYPAQVRVEVYNQCPALSEREFRSILKDCYTQDTSQSSRLCFELKRSEAQNLCRAFNGAAARVNLGSGASRPVTSAAAIQGSKPASASNAQDSSATSEEIFPALGSDWQEVGKKRQGTAASGSTSSNTVWGKPTPIPARTPSSNPPAFLDPPVAQPSRANGKSSKAPSVSGSVHGDSDHQADPHALATGAFDAPNKSKNKADSVASGPTTFTNEIAAAPSSSKPDNTNMTTTAAQPNGSQQTAPQAPPTQPPPPPRPEAVGNRSGGSANQPHSPSQQLAADLHRLQEAVQSLPGPVAEALARHASSSNEALYRAEQEQRVMARSLAAAQAQLAGLPQLQVEQRRLREGAAAMAAELVSLRQHVAMLTQPAGNGFIPPPRSSPGVPSPPQGYSSALSPGPSQSQMSPNLFQGRHEELYLTGGNDGVRWLDAVEVYSPTTGSWRTAQPMPLERGYGAAAAIERQLFVMGGGNGSSWLQSVMMCNLDSGAWVEVAPMEAVRGSLAAIAWDQKLYAMGGGQPAVNRDTTEIYYAQRNQWLAGPTMNFRRFTTAAALHNNSIFVLGGYDGTQYLRSVERLDPREGKWMLVAEMQQKRGSHASTVANGQIYALGGWDAHTFLASVEVYDARTDAWRDVAPMEESRAYGAAVTVDGNVYAVGGMQSEFHNEVIETYDYASDSWQRLAPPDHILQRRAFLAACVVDMA